jgi:thymidylate synthase (FAD)
MELKTNLYSGKGFVEILDVIPSTIPEGFKSRDAVIANTAKICTNSEPLMDDIQVYNFIEKLFKWGHFSPFEQAVLKFKIKLPYVAYTQLDRHRTFVYSSQLRRSGRYSKFSGEDFYIPDYFNSVYIEDIKASEVLCLEIEQALLMYNKLIESGVKKESARFVLPAFCLMYEDIVTVNLKNLLHFLALRTSMHAQVEIRELANAMFDLTKILFPYTIKIFAENIKPINYEFNEL